MWQISAGMSKMHRREGSDFCCDVRWMIERVGEAHRVSNMTALSRLIHICFLALVFGEVF
jgi:hypothetical protein